MARYAKGHAACPSGQHGVYGNIGLQIAAPVGRCEQRAIDRAVIHPAVRHRVNDPFAGVARPAIGQRQGDEAIQVDRASA